MSAEGTYSEALRTLQGAQAEAEEKLSRAVREMDAHRGELDLIIPAMKDLEKRYWAAHEGFRSSQSSYVAVRRWLNHLDQISIGPELPEDRTIRNLQAQARGEAWPVKDDDKESR